ncbi:MAG: Beta-lactamase hydrolase-like protein [Syntrophorhabdus sp. PtaU1.Bin002]|nr:MAG: Beta-lactamase hydrolase-like protein [Syntrophorhabdus sp. PtaB.Bin006]OPY67178.1 MAG: Beta-lactamase hydrolase-like protein [Syntrophorhabdus sp. PtaU1.Bin002]
MFVKQMQVSGFAVFAYIVACKVTNEALVIDPAAETDRILHEAESRGYQIKYIVNTHSHIDHIMGNKKMKELTNAEIIIHEKEAQSLIHQAPSMMQMFHAEPSPPADITVKDGDVITVGRTSLKVIHTPGHSPGSISLYHNGMVFTGDTLFVGGVGRTDLAGGSWQTLVSSIRDKLFTLPVETIVAPGHNYGDAPKSTIGREMAQNPYVGERAVY